MLKHNALNGWGLFFLVSIPMSVIIGAEMVGTDISVGEGQSHMISYSVRFAIPFIFLVVAASSFQVLFPGPLGMWWLRNRKYIGLCFAVAMAWQGWFIFSVSTFFRGYYFEEIYYFRDELEGTVGYLFLAAMVATSFHFGRRHVNPKQWKLIHKGGIYYLWAYAFSVYWWNLFYYPTIEPFADPRAVDYTFYSLGFLAFALRIAAWGKKRLQVTEKTMPENEVPTAFKALGITLIAFGLLVATTGLFWQNTVTAFMTGTKWTAEMELWLPYWPLEPYMSLIIIGLGTLLFTQSTRQVKPSIEGAQRSG